jgi:hypothetical protein
MHALAETSSVAHRSDPPLLPPPRHDLDADPQALAKLLKLSTIQVTFLRMIAVFLGEEVKGNRFEPAAMVTRLMSQCLEGFVHDSGGEIVHTTDYDARNEWKETTPNYRVVTTEAGTFRHLDDGFVFIQIPGQRAVVQFERGRFESHIIEHHIRVYTAGDSQQFFRRWSAYTRQHHYLRARAAFADGEPIIHSRRYTWDDVVLPDQIRAMLRTHIETFLAHAVQLRAAGMKGRRGLILSGPPGTGKTLVGKVLADTLGVTFLWVLPRHVQSSEGTAEILKAAKFLAPAVMLFEDLDLFGEDRETSKSVLLGELMNQLDGVSEMDGIVTIATTNRLEVVESALRNRPGRFDRVIELGLPNLNARRKLLQRLLVGVAESELAQLATATDGYSPAQLEEVVNTMHLLAAESGDKINGNGRLKIAPELIDRTVGEIGAQRKPTIGFGPK